MNKIVDISPEDKKNIDQIKLSFPTLANKFDDRMNKAIELAIIEHNYLEENNDYKLEINDAIKQIDDALYSLGSATDANSIQSMFSDDSIFGALNIKMQVLLNKKLKILKNLKSDISNGKFLKVDSIDQLVNLYPNISKDFLHKCGRQAKSKYPAILTNILIDYIKETETINRSNPARQQIKAFVGKIFDIRIRDEDLTKFKNDSNLSLTYPYIFYSKK